MKRYMWIVTEASRYKGSIIVGTEGDLRYYRWVQDGERCKDLDWTRCRLDSRSMRPLGTQERKLRGLPMYEIPDIPEELPCCTELADFTDPT